MALINKDLALQEVKRFLKSCAVGCGIEIMSYKRNRTVAIIKELDNDFLIIEKGYEENSFKIPETQLQKKLKPLIKREFPRSRKLRLHKFDHPDSLNRIHQKI